jgi:hypothetical protein
MVSGGSYGRMPAKYKMKRPRLTRTVVEPSPYPGAGPKVPRRPSEQTRSSSRPRPRKNPLPRAGESRRLRAAENLELRRLLHHTVERHESVSRWPPHAGPVCNHVFGLGGRHRDGNGAVLSGFRTLRS